MGGRLAIQFIAATPGVRAFVGYYPTVRDQPPTEMRPIPPWDAVERFKCPSIVLYGGDDIVTTIPVPVELASPLAVVIYELLENCFQHAFEPDSPANYLHIKLSHTESDTPPFRRLELSVQDNGLGMAIDFDNLESECHGLALIQSIVAKLDGTLEVSRTSGTLVKVEIPDLQYA